MHEKLTQLHVTVCGRGGLLERVEKVEGEQQKQNKIAGILAGLSGVFGVVAGKEWLK